MCMSSARLKPRAPSRHVAAVVVIAISVAIVAVVRAEARPLTLEDYYRIVTVQSPAMSPDGKWVAFIRTAIVEAENRRQSELWIVAADGSAPARRISDPALNASGPRWSSGRHSSWRSRAGGAARRRPTMRADRSGS